MSAAMELHVALSLRLDAIEAYRLAHAYRDEVTRANAARLEDRACDADFTASRDFCAGLREGAELLTRAAGGKQPSPAGSDPLVVSRFDVAMEHAPEEEPGLTVGAIAEDGRPVALRFDVETRRKVAGWLAPTTTDTEAYAGELAMLRGLVRTIAVFVGNDWPAEKQTAQVRQLLAEHAGDEAHARLLAMDTTPTGEAPRG